MDQNRPLSPYVALGKSHDAIRLLYLQPAAAETDPIICNLQRAVLPKDPAYRALPPYKPDYEALSYVWGPEDEFGYQITVNGVLVNVRINLWDALRTLRLADSVRVLWIDALCINQDDVIEKSQQAGVMQDIYRKSHQCISWINSSARLQRGGDDFWVQTELNGLKSGLAFMERAGKECRSTKHYPRVMLDDASKWIKKFVLAEDSYEHWCTLIYLRENTYWQRLWIAQEVLLPRDTQIQVRKSTCSWEHFTNVTSTVLDMFLILTILDNLLEGVLRDLFLWKQRGKICSLQDSLVQTKREQGAAWTFHDSQRLPNLVGTFVEAHRADVQC